MAKRRSSDEVAVGTRHRRPLYARTGISLVAIGDRVGSVGDGMTSEHPAIDAATNELQLAAYPRRFDTAPYEPTYEGVGARYREWFT